MKERAPAKASTEIAPQKSALNNNADASISVRVAEKSASSVEAEKGGAGHDGAVVSPRAKSSRDQEGENGELEDATEEGEEGPGEACPDGSLEGAKSEKKKKPKKKSKSKPKKFVPLPSVEAMQDKTKWRVHFSHSLGRHVVAVEDISAGTAFGSVPSA